MHRKGTFFLAFVAISSLVYSSLATPAFPLKASANSRYLVDQNNAPFLIVGDNPQTMITNVSEADAPGYFTTRKAQGFNTVVMYLMAGPLNAGRKDYSTYDGLLPFSTPGDISTPNPAYWARADFMINLALQNGFCIFLNPCPTGDFVPLLVNNGIAKCTAFGQFVGSRYNSPNIIWANGEDFQNWTTATDDAAVIAVANGIKSVASNNLQTVQLNYTVSMSLDDANWKSLIGLNWVYTPDPVEVETLKAYNANTIPCFLGEAHYEGEFSSTNFSLRRDEYYSALSGNCGYLWGNHYIWEFISGWQNNVSTPGATQFIYFSNLFQSLQWWNLVPDQGHTFVTAGFGSIGSSNYVASAKTPDGTLGIAYMPAITTITVDMAAFSNQMSAIWYDPSNGTSTAVAGSPFANVGTRAFTPPGKTSDGMGDWALVVTASSSPTPTPTPTPTPSPSAAAPLPPQHLRVVQ